MILSTIFIPTPSIERIMKVTEEIKIKKNSNFIAVDSISTDIFFIKTCIVKAYTSGNGRDITFWMFCIFLIINTNIG